jgi:hypothetical protein
MKSVPLNDTPHRNDHPASPSVTWRWSWDAHRHGVLLLVVLSMLTLFLMLGVAYLVAATRAREAARAYARLTLGSDDVRVPHAQLLDSILMRVLRGPATSGIVAGGTVSFESLLEDKYGTKAELISGTLSAISGVSASGTVRPILTGSLTLSGTTCRPSDLFGRVLTFAQPGRAATSHRIIRARGSAPSNLSSTSFTIAIDTPASKKSFTAPSIADVIINGREFDGDGTAEYPNESWDGFDSQNPFLARVGTATISTSTVTAVSYLPGLSLSLLSVSWDYDGDGIPDAADNDNDGIWDGVFLPFGIPDAVDGNGNAVKLRASVLIVDLDGRFNVNAHDSIARVAYSGTNMWPSVTGTSIPMGSGYGPAEVNGEKMFTSITNSTTENPALLTITGGTSIRLTGTRGLGTRFTQSSAVLVTTPRLDFVEGRYGRDVANPGWPTSWPPTTSMTLSSASAAGYSLPGISGTNDTLSMINDRRADDSEGLGINYGVPPVWWTGTTASFNWASNPLVSGTEQPLPRGVFNSPPDLHGRMRTTTISATTASAIVPQMVYGKPEWLNSMSSFETTDDPYDIALDTRTGCGGWLHDPAGSGISGTASYADNPFQLSELEPVLRPYDIDANRLPLRLAAILGSAAEASRLLVTTDSWDTTAVTGSAAQLIYGSGTVTGWLQQVPSTATFHGTSAVSGILGGEIARGERFDLNRPLQPFAIDTAGYTMTVTATTAAARYYVQRQAYFKDFYTLLYALYQNRGVIVSASNLIPIEIGTAAAHKLQTGDTIVVKNVGGNTAANGTWIVTVNSSTTCKLNGSEGNGVYTSGGSFEQLPPWSTTVAAELAQYAANVVEFRDADSVMTPFEYDVNPADGWAVDGDVRTNDGGNDRRVVFGAERPEILIQQAFAWRDSVSGSAGMVITLHRPWNARALTNTPTPAAIHAEPCDYALDTLVSPTNSTIIAGTAGVPNNLVDLGKKPHLQIMNGTANAQFNDTSQANYPIWRIRIVSGTETRYVRFDTNAPATGEFAPTITTGSSKPRLSPDSTLTLASGTTITLTATNSVTGTVTGTAFLSFTSTTNVTSTTITGMRVPGTSGTATISLERLSDPSQQPGNTVWATGTADPRLNIGITTESLQYVVIDSCTVPVIETGTAGLELLTPSGTSYRRLTTSATAAFWATGTTVTIGTISSGTTLTLPTPLGGGNNTVWFPWPNRPFVSSAELLLVPRFDSLGILKNYSRPTPANQSVVGIPVPLPLIFDAVHVPTRFAGIHRTYTRDHSADTGIYGITNPANQLSSFREPGRVNLNTVVSDDVWNAVVAGPLASPIVSRTNAGLAAAPARSMTNLLSLSATGTTVLTDTAPALASGIALNPLHSIYTATRLANTVTTRSNLFAIWITLRESTADDPDSVKYRRAFYIVDRSIPVGYEEGKDHNILDMIRLRRIIE